MCAALTSLGGGTIREILLRHLPAYFTDHRYLLATACGAAVAGVLYRYTNRRHRTMLLIDAVGLATFAIIGAEKADAACLGLIGATFFAALTAAGGGIMTDVVTHERPKALTVDLYILPAAIARALYHVLSGMTTLPNSAVIGCCLLVPLLIRVRWLLATGRLSLLGSGRGIPAGNGRARHRRRPAPVPD